MNGTQAVGPVEVCNRARNAQHAQGIFRTGIDGPVSSVRFYLFVNQVTNAVPFAVSSGVAQVGVRRGGEGLEFTAMEVILDTTNSVLLSERHAPATTGS